jgi:beta-glucosidase
VSQSPYPYQDASLDIEARVSDLVERLELEDKAGLMFQPMATVGDFSAPGMMGSPSMRKILDRRINHVNILTAPSAREIAEWHNAVQAEALQRAPGIPVTVSSDPRHAFSNNPAAALLSGPFSQFPDLLGFAALDDAEEVERFADLVRREYLAVGIRVALHPQVDLCTEPRWARQLQTFGSSAEVTGRLGAAYVRGLRGPELGAESVAAMAKHFPGGGPQLDGEDPHFDYGREQVYPGGRWDEHLQPFKDLIAAGVTQLMPYYGMPIGTEYEEVGFGFNSGVIAGLLREQLGFDGIVCTDWGILSRTFWGVEELTFEERMVKALDAGVDQFGGEFRPQVLVDLVRAGRVSEDRLDTSVRRLLREKFRLGLFDHPFVDADAADTLVGAPRARAHGLAVQAAAQVLLVNRPGPAQLPLSGQPKVYTEGMAPQALAGWANVVATPEEAELAIVRTSAPWEERGKPGDIDSFFHAGSLEFHADELAHLAELAAALPLVLDVHLDRPGILAPVIELASAVIGNFGSTDDALAQVVFGAAEPKGRLPFEIPSSMDAVRANQPDVPNDTVDPTFPVGFGLHYADFVPAVRPDPASTTIPVVERTARFDLAATPLKEILADPEARAILDGFLPGIADHPMIALAEAMPFHTVVGMAGGEAPPELLDELRSTLAALPPL